MEYAKSVRSALRPRTLFASAFPVLISASLLRQTNDISIFRLDVACVLACAVLTQLLGNLSAVYSNFHRTLQPKKAGDSDAKIVLNLLSLTQVRRWSFLFYALQLTVLGVTHVVSEKSAAATGGMVLLVTMALIYCRSGDDPLPIVGAKEAIVAWAVGPITMVGTALYVVGDVPWVVVMYAHVVMLFAWAFLVLQSAQDAPFARSMGRAHTSVALRLGFQWSFQGFLLLTVSCYGLLFMLGIALGHLGNLLLLVSIVKLKDMSEDFRLERLNHLPDQFARLAVALGFGLILSITMGLS